METNEIAKEENAKKPGDKSGGKRVSEGMVVAKYAELLVEKDRLPTTTELADALGVSKKTVERHLAGITFQERFGKFRAVSDTVIMNVYRQAATGTNYQWARLWFELVEGFGEKIKSEFIPPAEAVKPSSATMLLSNGTVIEM